MRWRDLMIGLDQITLRSAPSVRAGTIRISGIAELSWLLGRKVLYQIVNRFTAVGSTDGSVLLG